MRSAAGLKTHAPLPWRTMFAITAAVAVLVILNRVIARTTGWWELSFFGEEGSPRWFPFSVFRPDVVPEHMSWGVAMIAAVVAALRSSWVRGPWRTTSACILIVLLGNLARGGFDEAIVQPVARGDLQYHHDAVQIDDARAWLASFNEGQPELGLHTRTHPPFATLLHAVTLKAGGGPATTGVLLVCLSALAFPLARELFRSTGAGPARADRLTILLACVPAVNIYTATSLDGVIMATSALFLLAIARAIRTGPSAPPMSGTVALAAAGLAATSALSFASLFHLAAGGLVAMLAWRQGLRASAARVAIVVVLAAIAAALTAVVVFVLTGYDHLSAFRTAAALENPNGFRLLADPADYLVTRIEGVSEWLVMLSIPVLAMVATRPGVRRRPPSPAGFGRVALATAAAVTFLAMLATGAFRAGETGRVLLFAVPAVIPMLGGLSNRRLAAIATLAAIQTACMQIAGDWFW